MEFDRGNYSHNKYTYRTKLNKKIIMCYDKNVLQRVSKICKESVLNIIHNNNLNPAKRLMTYATHEIPVVYIRIR